MKFGKLLLRSVSLSCFESKKWMDYKHMKHLLYIAAEALDKRAKPYPSQHDELSAFLASVPQCVEFYRCLRDELSKVALNYAELETILSERYEALLASAQFLVAAVVQNASDNSAAALQHRSETARQMLSAAVRLTSSLIQLENYAVLNYCAFAKIMKKKEKVTGVPCKTAYMQACVNVQEFAHYPRLRRMLSGTERLYSLLVALQPDDAAISVDIEDAERLADLREHSAQANMQRSTLMSKEGKGPRPEEASVSSGSKRKQSIDSDDDSADGPVERPATRIRLDVGQSSSAMLTTVGTAAGAMMMQRSNSELALAALMAGSKGQGGPWQPP